MKRQRVAYSPEFKLRTVMESFTRNGFIKDFCESRNIPTCTFYKWLEEYNKRKDAEKEAKSASVDATADLKGAVSELDGWREGAEGKTIIIYRESVENNIENYK